MLKFGRPLAYDGVNLIAIDLFATEDAPKIAQRTGSPAAAIEYYIGRGDFKPDTAWKFHPWGQFIVAAMGIGIFGHSTFGARILFAVAGIATVLLLYRWVKVYFDNPLMAQIAALLLVFNAYWILHSRQCRYYSLSSLFLVLTLIAYTHWQHRGRLGAAAFVIAAWCWFQVDYGTLWPVVGVLFLDAFLAAGKRFSEPGFVGATLAATIAPFLAYYQPWNRFAFQEFPRRELFRITLLNVNEYVLPLLIFVAAGMLVTWRWKDLPRPERRFVLVGCGILCALAIWVPLVAPEPFLRYVIVATPVGCLLTAWVLVRGCALPRIYAWLSTAVLVLTPWCSLPVHAIARPPAWFPSDSVFRSELLTLRKAVFEPPPDPNRLVIEWLKQNAAPTEEILINYEDFPLMFYLPNPIRGGIAAFRAEDDTKTPPHFIIMRQSVNFVHWPVFQREFSRYLWVAVPVKAPDVRWGNNPDPIAQTQDYGTEQNIFVARQATRIERQ